MTEPVVDEEGGADGVGALALYGWRDPRYDAGLEELAALEVAEARLYAQRARTLAVLASRTSRSGWQGEAPYESLLLDVTGTCVLGQVAAGSRLADAEHLVLRLPDTLAAVQAGVVRVHQLRVLLEQTRELSQEVCAEVERRVLPLVAPLCPADLRRLLQRVVLQVESESAAAAREAEQRRRRARSDRRTWVRPVQDGMAVFGAVLPAEQAQQLQARLTEQARRARAAGDGRGLDQIRADLLADWQSSSARPDVGGEGPGAGRRGPRPRPPVQVVVHVPLAVALGLSDDPGELEGYGPISADHARRLLPGAELRRACIARDSGRVWALDDDTVRLQQPGDTPPGAASRSARGDGRRSVVPEDVRTALLALAALPPPVPLPPEPQHDPSAALARLVRARHVRCDGLGCTTGARRCELDHHVPYPAGATSGTNLRPRSQRCHHAKHAGWTAAVTTAGTTWTSPGGRRYVVPSRTPVHLSVARRTRRPEDPGADDGRAGPEEDVGRTVDRTGEPERDHVDLRPYDRGGHDDEPPW